MKTKTVQSVVKFISLLLILVLVLPNGALATESRASYYLDAYSAYLYPAGWGKVQVWFHITGTNDMDEIGALEIQLYESKDNGVKDAAVGYRQRGSYEAGYETIGKNTRENTRRLWPDPPW